MSIKQEVISRVSEFVVSNKDSPTDQRSQKVKEFTDKLVDLLIKKGYKGTELQSWEMKHPQLMKKSKARRYSILEILSDYILNVDQVAERKAEYPIMNVETEIRRENKRKKSESPLVLDEWMTGDHSNDWPETKIPGAIYEHSFNKFDSVQDELFPKETGSMSAEEIRKMIREVKAKPERYVQKYADGSAWNEDKLNIKRTRRRVRAAIRKLDEKRVRTCRVCKNGFYSRNGRHVCDVVQRKENPNKSVCEREYEKNYKKFSETS